MMVRARKPCQRSTAHSHESRYYFFLLKVSPTVKASKAALIQRLKSEKDEKIAKGSAEQRAIEAAITAAPKQHLVNTDKNGVIKQQYKKGKGNIPRSGAYVFFHCTSKLLNGTQVHSTRDNDKPFSLELGKPHVPCWIIALSTMMVGEKALITCQPKYAFYSIPVPDGWSGVHRTSTLQFDIEVIRSFVPGKDGPKAIPRPQDKSAKVAEDEENDEL